MGAQYPGFRAAQLTKDTQPLISHMGIQQVEVGEHRYLFARHYLLSILSRYGLTPAFFLSVACCCLGLVPWLLWEELSREARSMPWFILSLGTSPLLPAAGKDELVPTRALCSGKHQLGSGTRSSRDRCGQMDEA